VAAAALTPGLTAMALRFNANAVLVSVWPLAMAFFVRAMNRGLTRDAIAAGLLCGLAMLGKYFSAMMLGALLLSALCHAPWRARLFSRTGLCIAAVFAISLIPHGWWLMSHQFEPIRYAREATGFNTDSAAVRGLQFAGRMLLFPALGLLLLWLTVRPQIRLDRFAAIVGKCLRPSTDPLWILAFAPIVLSVVMTAITAARISTLWGLPMGMALVLLVASRLRTASSGAPHLRPAGLLLGVNWMAMAIAAPLYWHVGADRGDPTPVRDDRRVLPRQGRPVLRRLHHGADDRARVRHGRRGSREAEPGQIRDGARAQDGHVPAVLGGVEDRGQDGVDRHGRVLEFAGQGLGQLVVLDRGLPPAVGHRVAHRQTPL
jgi:hypothetical protein